MPPHAETPARPFQHRHSESSVLWRFCPGAPPGLWRLLKGALWGAPSTLSLLPASCSLLLQEGRTPAADPAGSVLGGACLELGPASRSRGSPVPRPPPSTGFSVRELNSSSAQTSSQRDFRPEGGPCPGPLPSFLESISLSSACLEQVTLCHIQQGQGCTEEHTSSSPRPPSCWEQGGRISAGDSAPQFPPLCRVCDTLCRFLGLEGGEMRNEVWRVVSVPQTCPMSPSPLSGSGSG